MIKRDENYDNNNFNDFRCNFSDLEIEMFFAKYDVDGDGIFSWDEGAQVSCIIFLIFFLNFLDLHILLNISYISFISP